MATDKTFSDKAAAWAFPIVTAVVGWLMVDKLNSLDRRLEKMETAAGVFVKVENEINHINRRMQQVEGRLEQFFLKEDEIRAPRRK